jgi:hypothetical protein
MLHIRNFFVIFAPYYLQADLFTVNISCFWSIGIANGETDDGMSVFANI